MVGVRCADNQNMNDQFNSGVLYGLNEALRLMKSEYEIDFSVGRIMKRIDQLKGESPPITDTDRITHFANHPLINTPTFYMEMSMSQELQKDALEVMRREMDKHMEGTK